jgi:hypothetical protein
MAVGERHQLRSKLGLQSEEDLRSQFLAFANFSNHGEQKGDMDGAMFSKVLSFRVQLFDTTQQGYIFCSACVPSSSYACSVRQMPRL